MRDFDEARGSERRRHSAGAAFPGMTSRRATPSVRRAATVLASALCVTAPGVASAQLFVDISGTPDNPAVCTTAIVTGTISAGIETLNLANSANNIFSGVSVNGGPESVQLQTVPGPFPANFPGGTYTIPLPAPTALPYALVAREFPALNGQAVGTGFVLTTACDINGAGTTVIQRGVAAPAPVTVPLLPVRLQVLMAVLLALLAGRRLAYRRR
jgi:hypothetical protein